MRRAGLRYLGWVNTWNMINRQFVVRVVFFSLMLGVIGVVQCQSSLVGTYWHNGAYFMPIRSETDSSISIITLSLHEGSGVDVWTKTSDPNVFIHPNQIGNAWTDTIIHYYDSIVHKTVDGQESLLVYGRERRLEDIYLRYDGRSANKWYEESHGFDSVIESNMRRRIMGSYRDGVQVWQITSDSIFVYSLSSFPNQPSYDYDYTIRWGETDAPERVIVLSDGRNICFEMTADGLDLYNGVVHVEEEGNGLEWISRGDLLCRLKKTDLDKVVPGRWPEASTGLLTRGYLEPYPTEVLRLIRNEIYARHGYRFSDQRLTDFYNKDGLWYGIATIKQQPTELTQVEQLNVELILTIEKERKNRKR